MLQTLNISFVLDTFPATLIFTILNVFCGISIPNVVSVSVSNEGLANDRLSYDIHNKKINYNIVITIAYIRVLFLYCASSVPFC
jgi:hypothetical protein